MFGRTCLLASLLLATSVLAAPGGKLLPATDSNAIYAPVALPGTPEADAIARAGYVQEEYLLSGTGNIYQLDDKGALSVRTPGLAYATRLVIVRPRSPKTYSGVVQLSFSHPQFGSNQWNRIAPYLLRSGDMYAMLMSVAVNRRGVSPSHRSRYGGAMAAPR